MAAACAAAPRAARRSGWSARSFRALAKAAGAAGGTSTPVFPFSMTSGSHRPRGDDGQAERHGPSRCWKAFPRRQAVDVERGRQVAMSARSPASQTCFRARAWDEPGCSFGPLAENRAAQVSFQDATWLVEVAKPFCLSRRPTAPTTDRRNRAQLHAALLPVHLGDRPTGAIERFDGDDRRLVTRRWTNCSSPRFRDREVVTPLQGDHSRVHEQVR